MKYYHHDIHGPHSGDPIAGSAEITAHEYAELCVAWFPAQPATSLQDLAAEKITAINAAKNDALDAGFLHGGVLYDSDYKARIAYLEAATQFQIDPEFSMPWKASTGQWVTMDAELFATLIPVYRAHVQACFAWQATMEAEVAAALALEDEVDARSALLSVRTDPGLYDK